MSTHSSLNIEIRDSEFSVWIDFASITSVGNHKFNLKSGTLKIEEELFVKGILKAEFDFKFEDDLFNKEEIFWKGKMFKAIHL